MKKFLTVVCLVSAMAVSGCATSDNWTPMSAGRTAGDGVIMESDSGKTVKHRRSRSADKTFNGSLRK